MRVLFWLNYIYISIKIFIHIKFAFADARLKRSSSTPRSTSQLSYRFRHHHNHLFCPDHGDDHHVPDDYEDDHHVHDDHEDGHLASSDQNESHPYLHEKDLRDYCKLHGIAFQVPILIGVQILLIVVIIIKIIILIITLQFSYHCHNQAYSALGSADRPWALQGSITSGVPKTGHEVIIIIIMIFNSFHYSLNLGVEAPRHCKDCSQAWEEHCQCCHQVAPPGIKEGLSR